MLKDRRDALRAPRFIRKHELQIRNGRLQKDFGTVLPDVASVPGIGRAHEGLFHLVCGRGRARIGVDLHLGGRHVAGDRPAHTDSLSYVALLSVHDVLND